MSLFNLVTTAAELIFGLSLVIMFLNQDKLVRFEKRLAVILRYSRKRIVRRARRAVRLKRAERQNHINKKFIYTPLPAHVPPTPDRAA